MKQSLQLKMSQSLTMTPQLQQAIKLLQLSSLDLEAEIQDVLESNPLLEVSVPVESTESNNKNENETASSGDMNGESQEIVSKEDKDSSEAISNDKIESEMISDSQWEDWGYVSQGSSGKSDENSTFEYQGETSDSLRDQLLWQVNMSTLSETDRTIATILIDSIDDSGFMKANLDDVLEMLNGNPQEDTDVLEELGDEESSDDETSIQIDEVEAVLHFIQSFDPAGIGARNLQECLMLQLNRSKLSKEDRAVATQVIQTEFDLLAGRNYKQVMKNLGLSEESLKSAIRVIQDLNPRPGSQLSQNNAQYIKPDVYVKKDKKGAWQVELNGESTPKLGINKQYANLIKRADNSPDNQFLKNNFQDAKWFIKSLQSRNETLLKVATSIVEKQIGFLEYGEEAMKPLVLHDIAEEVEMHESTISRVTTQKFMHTPKGIFELKYFFSSHVGTASGGECSSTAIRAVIKKLIAAENQSKPLSDSKIANLLKEQGIKVARRTVAKYRESMAIPPSNERKALL
jgi:RNA polymerase sigma-54 factor